MSDQIEGAASHEAIPTFMPPLYVKAGWIDGEEAVLVGALPHGYTVVLCPSGWRQLQRNKLTRLRVSNGKVRACGDGRSGGFVASRFLTGATGNHIVSHRNGNPFDLRLCNLAVLSRGLLRQAEIEASRGPDYGKDVQLSDGRWRSCRRAGSPSAHQRIEDALTG